MTLERDGEEIETLKEVLDSTSLLKKFRLFLRGQLALENLLFYEGITVFEKSQDEEERQAGGIFMVNQFVRQDSEDATNISSILREKLEATKIFTQETFFDAKNEMYRLLQSNFFSTFTTYLSSGKDNGLKEFSPYLSKSYFLDLSFDSLDQILRKNDKGEVEILPCSCTTMPTDKKYCCEIKRSKMKVIKRLKLLRISLKPIKRGSLAFFKFGSKTKNVKVVNKGNVKDQFYMKNYFFWKKSNAIVVNKDI